MAVRQPLTVLSGAGGSPTGAASNLADRLCDGRGKQPDLPGKPHSGAWFKTACYTQPSYIDPVASHPNRTRQFGTTGIGTVIGPNAFSYDANLQKAFLIYHESTLNLRLDVFNPFNHPTLATPGLTTTDSASTYGHITGVSGAYQPRQIQVGVRYSF